MDEDNQAGSTPPLDDSFVDSAALHEPSFQERLGPPSSHRNPTRDRHQGPGRPASRTRKTIGILITVAVLLAAYVPTRVLGGHSNSSLLSPYLGPSTSCSSFKYPHGAQYRFEGCSGDQPVRWGHCATLAVAVDPSNGPAGWSSDVDNALHQLSRATGLRFSTASGSGNINIGWDRTLVLRGGGHLDKAGITSFALQYGLSSVTFSSATIRISSMLSGGAGLRGELPVLLHELGHAVGLGHFLGPEVMNPVVQGFNSYQAGDLAGLSSLYGGTPCS